jgi:hypothetical protein
LKKIIKKNENDEKDKKGEEEEYNVDNLKLDLDGMDLEEFKQFVPTLLIYKGEKIYSL